MGSFSVQRVMKEVLPEPGAPTIRKNLSRSFGFMRPVNASNCWARSMRWFRALGLFIVDVNLRGRESEVKKDDMYW